ncbi:MAG TPA: ABC transporter permease [Burkholderiales bacterium]|nr:ABC transporter permease [Burkholderiales bacterium]
MSRLRQWLIRLTTSMTRRHDTRLREEIDDHVAFDTEANLRRGLPPAEARRRALVTFGSMAALEENYRDQQGVPALEHLVQDVRVALRRMWKTPGFTAAAIATLALGLGLTSAVMSLAYALFVRPLPVDDATKIVFVDQTRIDRPVTRGFWFSYPDYLYLREHARAFTELAAHNSTAPPMTVATPGGPVGVSGAVVTANYFTLLRLTPRAGRFFSVDEDRVPGRDAVAILSYDFWRTRFAEDPNLLGTTVPINGTPFTVIGIAPEHFHGIVAGLEPNAVWIPTAMYRAASPYCDAPLSRACGGVGVIGRLAGDTSIDQAHAELAALVRQLKEAYREDNLVNGVLVRPVRGVRDLEQVANVPIVALLAGAAGLVLLVASANVAGLLLARGLRRRKEIAVRLAIGASRGRLIRLLLVESVMLAAAGGVAGQQIAVWTTEGLRVYFPNLDLSLNPRIALIGLGVALFTGVATGIAPALQSTRSDMALAMKEGSFGAGRPRSIVRDGLIVVQVALSVLLLGAGGLLVRSFFVLHRGPGFDPDRVAIVRLRPSLVGFTNERAWAYQREVIERLEALPGVPAASPASAPASWRAQPVTPARLPGDSSDPAHAYNVGTTFVGPRYFKTLGVGVVEGREFDGRDTMDGPRVAIVNETLARHFWPNGGAVGRVITVGPDRVEVVGVVKALQWTSALQQPDPVAYLNFWQQDRGNRVAQDSRTHIRVAGDVAALLPEIQRTIAAVDPDVPISEPGSLGARLDAQFKDVRAARTMLVTFGALALGLSMIGLYAALAFAVGERTREIAVRLALGASRADVGRLVFRRGMAIVLLGIAAGVAACVIAGPFLAHLLYGVSPRDPLAITAGPAVLIVIAALAISLPARRAMKQNPIIALRAE